MPAKRVDIVLSRSHQAEFPVRVLVWGLDPVSPRSTPRRMVREDGLPRAKRVHSQGRPWHHARCLEAHRTRRRRRHRRFSIVGGKIYVKRLKDVKSETSVYTLEGKPAGTVEFDGIGSASAVHGRTRSLRLFQLRIVHSAANALPHRHNDRQKGSVRTTENALRHHPIRTQAGLLQVERWHAGPHVHRRQKRPASGRHPSAC